MRREWEEGGGEREEEGRKEGTCLFDNSFVNTIIHNNYLYSTVNSQNTSSPTQESSAQ